MSGIRPLISIKAGKCSQVGTRVIPTAEPGVLYLYNSPDDGLLRFCWKPRSAEDPEDDLIIFPSDAVFTPYRACTTGRVFVLKFSSSSQRHFYWLQAKSESEDGDPGYWSARDRRWGETIDRLIQGTEDDDDEEMGDPDAELGSEDIEEEGNASRRGGEDGGRATSPSPFTSSATEPQSQNDFLRSLIQSINVGGPSGSGSGRARYGQQTPSISLHDLLASSSTVPILSSLAGPALDNIISNLPPALIPKNATEAQKKEVIRKVLQTPQFIQSCVSLTVALREGALRGVADSLGVPLKPGEEASGDQVEVFVKGVKRGLEEAEKEDVEMD